VTPTSTATEVIAGCLPKLALTVPVGAHPKGIAASGGKTYVGLFDDSAVAVLDGVTGSLLTTTATAGGHANGVAIWRDKVYMANRDSASIAVVDAATYRLKRTIPVGRLPWGVAAAEGYVYVANFADASVSVIDATTDRVVATVSVSPYPALIAAWGDHAYVTHLEGTVSAISAQGEVTNHVPIAGAFGVAIDPGSQRAYVGSGENHSIWALGLSDLERLQVIDLPGRPYALALNANGYHLFAVDAETDLVHVVDTRSGTVVGSLFVGHQDEAEGGQGIAVAQNRVYVSNYGDGSVTIFDDSRCSIAPPVATPTVTPSSTPRPTATSTPTPMPATATPTPTATTEPTPSWAQAKVEIVWPHGGAGVEGAELANVTAYLFTDDALHVPPCAWEPTVSLWAAVDAEPAQFVGQGEKRFASDSGRRFPVWDFTDVDVNAARDPLHKVSLFVTTDEVPVAHNIWTHAADARTLLPHPAVPTGLVDTVPPAVDARIQIVWPHDNAPVERAERANITAVLFRHGSREAIPHDLDWQPVVRLYTSLNTDVGPLEGEGTPGTPRSVTEDGITHLVWDFNDVDVSAAQDPQNKLYFWVQVDDVPTYPSVWAHGTDARTVFPRADVPAESCR
jgi:YVTN family beta-propeller protein